MNVLAILAEAGPSKTPFFIVGGVLAAWAVTLAAFGLSRHEFPGTDGAQRGVMAISTLLVVATMATAIATS
jgi:hypothetical protein